MVNPVRRVVAGAAICSLLAMGAPAGAAKAVTGPEEGGQAPGRFSDLSAATDFSVFRMSFGEGQPAGVASVEKPGSRWGRRHAWRTRHEELQGDFFLLREEKGKPEGGGSGTFPSKPSHYVLLGLMVEGLLAFNSYLATLDSDIYGGFAIAMAPMAGLVCEGCNKAEAIVGGVALAGIGAYNLTLEENRLSSGDIFRKNFVAWHVAAAAMGITSFATSRHPGKKKKGKESDGESGGSLRLSPVPGGIGVHYRFRR